MPTPSVNVVQSSLPNEQQDEISGLSRSVPNLGSSLGTAVAGTLLRGDLDGRLRPLSSGERVDPLFEAEGFAKHQLLIPERVRDQ